jgi:hypothetical protein
VQPIPAADAGVGRAIRTTIIDPVAGDEAPRTELAHRALPAPFRASLFHEHVSTPSIGAFPPIDLFQFVHPHGIRCQREYFDPKTADLVVLAKHYMKAQEHYELAMELME